MLGALTTGTAAECGAIRAAGRAPGALRFARVPLFAPSVPRGEYASEGIIGRPGAPAVTFTPEAAKAAGAGAPIWTNDGAGAAAGLVETDFNVAADVSCPRGPARITPFEALPANTTWMGALDPGFVFPGFTGVASLGVHPT